VRTGALISDRAFDFRRSSFEFKSNKMYRIICGISRQYDTLTCAAVPISQQFPASGRKAKKGVVLSSSAFSFTQLTEPSTYASPAAPASPFSASMAALLGQCCVLTYEQLQGTDITS